MKKFFLLSFFFLIFLFFFSLSTPVFAAGSLEQGLVGYWTLDGHETSWTTDKTNDLSGSGNTGQMVSMSTTTSPTVGKLGQALKFDGVSQYVSVGTGISFLKTSAFSVSVWYKSSASLGSIVTNWNVSTSPGWEMIVSGGNIYFGTVSASGAAGYIRRTSSTYNDNKWHHIVGVYGGSLADTTAVVYVDGVAVSMTSVLNTDPGTLVDIGTMFANRSDGGTLHLAGSLDDVRIYSRALSAAEVKQLYQLGQTQVNAQQTSSAGSINSGLVGYWPLDGKNTSWTTDKTNDIIGTNHGQMVNMSTTTSPVVGKLGQALKLNGTSNTSGIYVSIPSSTNLNLQGNVATFSLWVNPVVNSWPSNYTSLISKRTPSVADTYEIYLELGTGKLGFYNGALYTTNYVVPTKIWTHVVVTVSGSVCTFYANGNLITTKTSCNIGSATSANVQLGYYFGNDSSDQQQFYGTLDDVRIYSRALSAAEVKQLYQLGQTQVNAQQTSSAGSLNSGLVGYWTMDGKDTSWTTDKTNDVSGNANTGQMVAMSTTTSPVVGKLGQALKFNGTNQYINVADSNSLSVTTAITLSYWVKVNDLADYRYIVEKDSGVSGTREYQSYINKTDGKVIFVAQTATGSGLTIYTSTTAVAPGVWTHVTVTYDGSNIRSYFNGVQDSTVTPCTVSYGNTSRPLTIGYGNNSTWYMKGIIDDLRIYSRALSAAEVGQLYKLGSVKVK